MLLDSDQRSSATQAAKKDKESGLTSTTCIEPMDEGIGMQERGKHNNILIFVPDEYSLCGETKIYQKAPDPLITVELHPEEEKRIFSSI